MPFPPSASFVENKYVKLHDLHDASAVKTQGEITPSPSSEWKFL